MSGISWFGSITFISDSMLIRLVCNIIYVRQAHNQNMVKPSHFPVPYFFKKIRLASLTARPLLNILGVSGVQDTAV